MTSAGEEVRRGTRLQYGRLIAERIELAFMRWKASGYRNVVLWQAWQDARVEAQRFLEACKAQT